MVVFFSTGSGRTTARVAAIGLDVYKRQPVKRLAERQPDEETGQRELRGGGFGAESVSYTHLDVYKRQPHNSLVLYKGGPARVVAIGDKLEIELEDGRSLRVRPKDVVVLHPGPLAGLRELPSPAGEVEAACELLEGGRTTLPELAELVYGSYSPATAWAAWRDVYKRQPLNRPPLALRSKR